METLGKEPSTLQFLQHIKTKLAGREVFNLWTETLNFNAVNGNKEKAISIIGALFQDRAYSSQGALPTAIEVVKDEVLVALYRAVESGQVKPYPPGVNTSASGFYHFYANALIAQNLSKKKVPRRCAAAMPFSFNEWYEQDFRPDTRLDDTYTGYAGPEFALSEDRDEFTGAGFQNFQSVYKQEGRHGVGQFFRRAFGGDHVFCAESPSIDSNVPTPQVPSKNSEAVY